MPDGSLTVERWPRGQGNQIGVPPHTGGMRAGRLILATFHAHPNTGPGYLQEPSLTDIRAVRDDPDLRHSGYEGEYVISSTVLYRVLTDGSVEQLGDTRKWLNIP